MPHFINKDELILSFGQKLIRKTVLIAAQNAPNLAWKRHWHPVTPLLLARLRIDKLVYSINDKNDLCFPAKEVFESCRCEVHPVWEESPQLAIRDFNLLADLQLLPQLHKDSEEHVFILSVVICETYMVDDDQVVLSLVLCVLLQELHDETGLAASLSSSHNEGVVPILIDLHELSLHRSSSKRSLWGSWEASGRTPSFWEFPSCFRRRI